MTLTLRVFKLIGWLFAINIVAGCAINTLATGENGTKLEQNASSTKVLSYQGRIALRVASDPPQSLYAGFSLNGDAQTGDLTLNSPLGNMVAQLTWTPQSAVLKANNETKEYPSASALIENVTGTAIPLTALFDWLAGKNTVAEGWEIDVSDMKNESANNETVQRLIAKRSFPLPTAELRIAIYK
jgi:outer membrane lipoprotein LolB